MQNDKYIDYSKYSKSSDAPQRQISSYLKRLKENENRPYVDYTKFSKK